MNVHELVRQLITCITPLVAQSAPTPADEPAATRALRQQAWAAVQRWLQGDAEAATVLQLYQARPDHLSYQHLLIEQVQNHLAHNEMAAAEVADLMRQWQQATGQQTSVDQMIEAANITDAEQQSANYDRVKQQATAAQDIVGFTQRAVRRRHSAQPPSPSPPSQHTPPVPHLPAEQYAVDPRHLRAAMCKVYSKDRFELLCLDLGTSYDRLRGDTLETRIAYLIDDYLRSSRYEKLVQHVLNDYPHLRQQLRSGG